MGRKGAVLAFPSLFSGAWLALAPCWLLSAMPPGTNPQGQQNKEALKELQDFLSTWNSSAFLTESRWHFGLDRSAPLGSLRGAARRCASLRCVALHAAPAPELRRAEELGRWVVKEAAWSEVFAAWKALEMAKPRSCHVHLRRRKQSGTWPSDVSLPLRRALATQLEETFGWTPEVVRSEAEMELQVVLGEDGRILVEIPLLVQTRGLSGGLPFPGMKQVEAWVLAKALQLQPGEVVLDPMCGKGTLLCEAAIWWPEASFIGCDVEAQQLEKCLANHRYLGLTELVVHQADAATLGGLPIADSSVDKLMCAPPWDRQFEAAGGLENFYPKMLEEFSRVLRSNGTMAFLLNLPAEEALKASLAGWRTCRCPFALTHHTVGVLLLAWKVGDRSLDWCGPRSARCSPPRRAWKTWRAKERPPLKRWRKKVLPRNGRHMETPSVLDVADGKGP
ncbi:unnamed protein product [Durusdinium trenchii]|uniref:Ribosomal RNA large subunit methyltransferase K/L-like methyltransferase domain-containing protein n=1 Tax=Durusdinium trenchii TaxID=1381693 RepID=A0ABP0RFI3_9DINO